MSDRQKIPDAEMHARIEWTRAPQADPSLNLSDIVEIIENKHTIWPVADLKGAKGNQRVNRWTPPGRGDFNPYAGSSQWGQK